MLYVNYGTVVRDIVVDMFSLYFYAYLLIFRRYENRELFITCSLFNVALLMVVMTIVRTDFNLAVGFGLFALLSVITVRSTPFSRTEIAYFFGGLALAVINGSGISDFSFVVTSNIIIVGFAWVLSSWSMVGNDSLIKAVEPQTMSVVLEGVDNDATSDAQGMREKLSRRYNILVKSYMVKKIDHVKETMELDILFDESVSDGSDEKSEIITSQEYK